MAKNLLHCETGFGVYRSTQLGHIPFFLLLYLLVGPSIVVQSQAINFGRQYHFKISLDYHKLKKNPFLIMPMSTKCQKNEKKMTIDVIQHDDRL
jgi:hypothetical protein